ncbi:MAG: hypothetical protein ACE5G2_01695 [Candidatus Krumholzibacteriia bacterium]
MHEDELVRGLVCLRTHDVHASGIALQAGEKRMKQRLVLVKSRGWNAVL